MWPTPRSQLLACWSLLLALGAGRSALGQSLDRPEGIGLKIGEGRLHVSTQVETHYVYNPGFIPADGSLERGLIVKPTSDVLLLVRPGLDYSRPSPKLELGFSGDLDYHKYLGLQRSDTAELSGTAGHATASAVINKESWLSLRLRDALVRGDEPGNQTLYEHIRHTSNEAAAGVDIAPGGGALRVSLDYAFFIDLYDDDELAALDNIQHRPALAVHWKFLPKTAAFVQAQGTLTSFNESANVGSNLVQAYAGVTGSVTPKVTALLKAGYGNTFVNSGGDNFSSVLGQVEFSYEISPTAKTKVGFVRAVQPTGVYKYFSVMRGYGRVDLALGSRVVLGLAGDASLLSFGGEEVVVPVPPGSPPNPARRQDLQLTGTLDVGYHVTKWLVASIVDRVDSRSSDYNQTTGGVSYFFNDLFLRLEGRY